MTKMVVPAFVAAVILATAAAPHANAASPRVASGAKCFDALRGVLDG